MRMLALIPAVLSGHSHAVAELLLGLLFLVMAVMILVAGIWWFRFPVINGAALVFSGLAAYLFRRLSYTSHLGTIGMGLCGLAIFCAAVAVWRVLTPKKRSRPYKRGRRRKRRIPSPKETK